MGIIYCAQNKVNGKRYIGQCKNSLEVKRWAYVGAARRGVSQVPLLLLNALREFGEDAFEWTAMFDDVDNEDLDQLEADTITVYKTLAPNGYNLMSGGRKGGKYSQESKKRMSEVRKKRPPISDETRQRLREAHIGHKVSDETKKKMSRAQNRRKPPSEETRKKISEAGKRRYRIKELSDVCDPNSRKQLQKRSS